MDAFISSSKLSWTIVCIKVYLRDHIIPSHFSDCLASLYELVTPLSLASSRPRELSSLSRPRDSLVTPCFSLANSGVWSLGFSASGALSHSTDHVAIIKLIIWMSLLLLLSCNWIKHKQLNEANELQKILKFQTEVMKLRGLNPFLQKFRLVSRKFCEVFGRVSILGCTKLW